VGVSAINMTAHRKRFLNRNPQASEPRGLRE
jgi:hypothetical protein